ncbi:MAG: hypothetical protein ACLSHC_15800 [Bilophila wadsworthia]
MARSLACLWRRFKRWSSGATRPGAEVCVPGAAELNLKELAAVSGNKHVEMVPLKEVSPHRYIRVVRRWPGKSISRLRGRKRHPP